MILHTDCRQLFLEGFFSFGFEVSLKNPYSWPYRCLCLGRPLRPQPLSVPAPRLLPPPRPQLLALRADGLAPGLSWWNVFVPLFAADGLSAYFTTIVSVRLFQDGEKRLAVLRLFWVLTVLSLKFVFEMLLCQKLVEQTRELWFGLIASPVFILLQLLMIRACRVN